MGAFASSDLPQLAILGVRVFIYPLIGALWYNNRCNSGWVYATTYVYFWWLISVGFNLQGLFSLFLTGGLAAITQDLIIYFVVFPIIILVAAILGAIICSLLDIRETMPFYALFPSFITHNVDYLVSTPCNPIDIDALKAFYCMCQRGLERWCFSFIDPPYLHTLVGFILSIIVVSLPDFLFWFFVESNKLVAFLVPLGLKIGGYILAWLYWSYRTDLYVWGPSAYNMAFRRESVRKDPDRSLYANDPNIDAFDTVLFAETQSVINKNVLVMALIDIFGFLLIGGVIVIPTTPNVNVVIWVGIAYLLLILIIVILIGLILYLRGGNDLDCPRYCPRTGLLLANNVATTPVSTSINVIVPTKQIASYANKKLNKVMSNIVPIDVF